MIGDMGKVCVWILYLKGSLASCPLAVSIFSYSWIVGLTHDWALRSRIMGANLPCCSRLHYRADSSHCSSCSALLPGDSVFKSWKESSSIYCDTPCRKWPYSSCDSHDLIPSPPCNLRLLFLTLIQRLHNQFENCIATPWPMNGFVSATYYMYESMGQIFRVILIEIERLLVYCALCCHTRTISFEGRVHIAYVSFIIGRYL